VTRVSICYIPRDGYARVYVASALGLPCSQMNSNQMNVEAASNEEVALEIRRLQITLAQRQMAQFLAQASSAAGLPASAPASAGSANSKTAEIAVPRPVAADLNLITGNIPPSPSAACQRPFLS
jgi:hypothetical protein